MAGGNQIPHDTPLHHAFQRDDTKTKVEIVGFKRGRSFNGKKGFLQAFSTEEDRWLVVIDDDEILLSEEHLRLASETDSVTHHI